MAKIDLLEAFKIAGEFSQHSLGEKDCKTLIPDNMNEIMKAFKIDGEVTSASVSARNMRLSAVTPRLEQEANRFARPLANRLRFLRQCLIPMIKTVGSQLEEKYMATSYKQPEIQEIGLPDIFLSTEFKEMTTLHEAYSGNNGEMRLAVNYDELDEEMLLGLMETSNQGINDALTSMLADDKPRGWLNEVYKKYFIDKNIIQLANHFTLDSLEVTSELIVCYLILGGMIGRNYASNKDTSPTGEYQYKLANDYALIGGSLYGRINNIQSEINQGRIIIGLKEGIYYAYQDNYDKYFDQGGSLDALIYSITRGGLSYIEILLAKNEEYSRLQQQDIVRFRERQANDYKLIVRKHFGAVFMNYIRNEMRVEDLVFFVLPEERDAITTKESINYDEIVQRASEYFVEIFQQKENIIETLEIVLLERMVNVSPFLELYQTIEAVSGANPEINVREIAANVILNEIITAVLRVGFDDSHR